MYWRYKISVGNFATNRTKVGDHYEPLKPSMMKKKNSRITVSNNQYHKEVMMIRKKWKGLAILAALAVFMSVASAALAWTYLGSLNGGTKWYSPYTGEKWGQIRYSSGFRLLDVEAYNLYYGDRYNQPIRMVFHAFQTNTNCYIAMGATGYWWTNFPNPGYLRKTAKCGSEPGSYYNEVRIQPNLALSPSGTYYYAGAEYRDRAPKLGGEMSYDGYGWNAWDKEWLGKFYFETNDNLHQ